MPRLYGLLTAESLANTAFFSLHYSALSSVKTAQNKP